MSTFTALADVRREQFDWGVIGWRLVPAQGADHLVVMDVELQPGGGHDFHRHPGQEEIIIVKEGEITQFVGQESATLGVGDSVFVPEGEVHASFNDTQQTAYLQVVLSPSLGGETGYGLEDVAAQEPWASLRTR
ncbi:MAG TPA: cupin domain-containing protein [Nocardioidaceae bacterium]|jgi:quercetin dioxygenase-like cupin family protein|nr:cupin domain-containing protein [Nocardioidaceae bacterium]